MYGLGFIGAVVFYIQHADTFWAGVVGLLKAIVWPAFLVYEALKALHSVLDQRMPDGRTLNQHLSQEVFECFYGPAIAARAAIAKAEGS